jgi:hypothetical protein
VQKKWVAGERREKRVDVMKRGYCSSFQVVFFFLAGRRRGAATGMKGSAFASAKR